MVKHYLKGGLALLVVATALAVATSAYKEHRYRQNMPLGEATGPNEDAVMAGAIAMALKMINNTRDDLTESGIQGAETVGRVPSNGTNSLNPEELQPVIYRRDVHIKSHGCVNATFTVPRLEAKYRWGVFREPRSFDAVIRFSNGDYTMLADSERDARGMAVKLLGVPGAKILDQQEHALTQDFVMMNNPVYFIRELNDYVELTKYLAVGDNFGYFLNGWSWNPFSWKWRELRLVMGTKKPPPETPLTAQYFSASAFKLGPDHSIKFSARPAQCPGVSGSTSARASGSWETGTNDYNFLRHRMSEQLSSGPACFDFMVQMQVPGKMMPVEDSTIVWREKDSPFVPVATIEIPSQNFDTEVQNQACENLSYNPWHALPDHRPVGVFNRVRKALYAEVAKYRWTANQSQESSQPSMTLNSGQPPEPDAF